MAGAARPTARRRSRSASSSTSTTSRTGRCCSTSRSSCSRRSACSARTHTEDMAVGAGAEKAAFRRAVNARLVELLRTGSIALAVLLSGFVLHEPAPYELLLVVLIPVWALFGLRLSRHIAPLIALLVLFNVGGLLAMTQMDDLG